MATGPTGIELLASWLKGHKDAATGKVASWWRWPLVILLVVVGLLVAYWLLMRDRRELARLRHERFKANEEARQAAIDAQVNSAKATAEDRMHRVREATRRLGAIDLELVEAERRYEANTKAADSLTWRALPRGDGGSL
jgi:hypothetical protein